MMAEELNVDRKTVGKTSTKVTEMSKVPEKMVPQILTGDQKQQQLDIYSDLSCQLAERKNFWVELSWVLNHGAFNMI
jgi:hypothetical protein